jgi:hypothetical protein
MSPPASDRNTIEYQFAPVIPISWDASPELMVECPQQASGAPEGAQPDPDRKEANDRPTALFLRFANVPIPPDGPVSVRCLDCDQPVEMHQPDSELPERMLGTCEHCQAWYLLECDPDAAQAVLILLPDFSLLRGLPKGPSPTG